MTSAPCSINWASLAWGAVGRNEDGAGHAGARGQHRQAGRGVAGGGAGQMFDAQLPGTGHGHGGGPVLEAGRRQAGVVLQDQGLQTQVRGQPWRCAAGVFRPGTRRDGRRSGCTGSRGRNRHSPPRSSHADRAGRRPWRRSRRPRPGSRPRHSRAQTNAVMVGWRIPARRPRTGNPASGDCSRHRAGRLPVERHHASYMVRAIRPLAVCSRFSASSQTTECGPSITPSVTSVPRLAGNGCM